MGLGLFLLVRYIVDRRTPQDETFTFERGVPGSFEPRLASYIRAIEYLLGLATGSIVLLVGSSALHPTGTLPWVFASPLIVLGFCVVSGVLFMVLMIYTYEAFTHSGSYTRAHYVWNQSLGFNALACFCLGYLWLVCSVSISLAK